MVAVLTDNKIRAVFIAKILAVTLMAIFSMLVISPDIRAENYAACTYSSGDYNSSESCDDSAQASVTGDLSGTGADRIKYGIFAFIGLAVGIGSGIVLVRQLYKSKNKG